MKFKGENAWWFLLIVIVYNVAPLFFLFHVELNGIVGIVLLIYYAFDFILLPITFRNSIVLFDDSFVFTYGFSKETIEIKDIIKLEKSRNSTASSANSFHRIYIQTNTKELYIALKDNDTFIKEVKKRMVALT